MKIPKHISHFEPIVGKAEKIELMRTIDSTWISEGKRTREFEKRIAKLSGASYAIAVNNGTVGLLVSLIALGIKPNQEVLVPDLTYLATVSAIAFLGAKPVPVDIDPTTLQLDVNGLKRHLTKQTVGVLPVHLYGMCVDMDPLLEFAREHHLWVLEDAAEAIGVGYKGRQVGALGDLGVFSFYANKLITTGEGGCVVTNSKRLSEFVFRFIHGGRERGSYWGTSLGLNFCFTDLQAALGLSQLKRLRSQIRRRQHTDRLYRSLLSDIRAVHFLEAPSFCTPTYWFTNIFVPDPQKLSMHLRKHGIETRRIFPPLHRQPFLKKALGKTNKTYPHSNWAYFHGLSLPSGPGLADADVRYICGVLRTFYRKFSPSGRGNSPR
ncbi:MAG: hypothetical protein A2900_03345 [Candidatus Chisholmbacteria bacterium RIFCSPLOWO2_01_FULL_50_28]|uniref:Aminotransferase n=1 Tax=Candidatus Chisholmbacteria bacterium RIFCSPHIGHO2_01_FULL_52_32 TaxID=1797591 RepID=A0A1G1VTI8_9BACT|nr:MAG: hypothetical protein A2786_03400 [Candidatus Chisholmbacteria bacterium RIFCSPHIGHO2_01_FULL_52_32]OGY20112.1 MAG: hypothetical protein A2900_03345 [Candidatus Chisholmbacteria bacterium RIFCSPLOWO2_01_FULL_50_28]